MYIIFFIVLIQYRSEEVNRLSIEVENEIPVLVPEGQPTQGMPGHRTSTAQQHSTILKLLFLVITICASHVYWDAILKRIILRPGRY